MTIDEQVHSTSPSGGTPTLARSGPGRLPTTIQPSFEWSLDREKLSKTVLPGIVLGILVAGYLLLWYDRFIGLSSNGWFYFYARQFREGAFPYRDFYVYVPPLHMLKFAALQVLFGDGLIVARTAAVVERTVLSVMVYCWLKGRFSAGAAFAGAFSASILFSGDPADALSLHHHDSVFWAVAAAWAANAVISGRTKAPAYVSGALACLCFLSKQTTGSGISVAIPLVLTLATAERRRVLLRFTMGWACPAVALAAWLYWNNAAGAFVVQVFVKGPSSKGPLLSVLFRPVLMCIQQPEYGLSAVAAMMLLGLAYWSTRATKGRAEFAPVLAWIAAGGALASGWALAQTGTRLLVAGYVVNNVIIMAVLIGCLGLVMAVAQEALRDRSNATMGLLLMAGTSSAVAFMLSLSWVAYAPMVMPGLAVLVALLLDRGGRVRLVWAAALWVSVVMTVNWKLVQPFLWSDWKEGPVSGSTVEPAIPELAGFRLSPETSLFLERVTRAIEKHSGPEDPVYVFPYAPLFYAFSHRKPATFAYVQWFDVTPDYIAAEDADRLRMEPPKVVVYFRLSESRLKEQEVVFRGSASSGQRKLIEEVERMVGRYRVVERLEAPLAGTPVEIYVRP